MRALCWYGPGEVRVTDVPEPTLLRPTDAIVRVTSTAICGSDLHLYNGYVTGMRAGDILGHEFMGEVVEVGSEVRRVSAGDRIVVAGTIACGRCWFCRRRLFSACADANPMGGLGREVYGHPTGALYGYSAAMGGYAGGQAQYVRVPFVDVGAFIVPDGVPDERVLFLSDILSTGWMAAELCAIEPGDSVAVFGAGPVGLLAIQSALVQGAGQVVAIDRVPERLRLAEAFGAIALDDGGDVVEALTAMTGGRGPDACIDAVGMEAHDHGVGGFADRIGQVLRTSTERPTALRGAIQAVRKGGTVAIAGAYVALADRIPLGAIVNKGLTLRSGQVHVQRYLEPLYERIERGELAPERVITHRLPLEEAPHAYRIFRDKEDGCIKVVLRPAA